VQTGQPNLFWLISVLWVMANADMIVVIGTSAGGVSALRKLLLQFCEIGPSLCS
jgi:hypothetical protein